MSSYMKRMKGPYAPVIPYHSHEWLNLCPVNAYHKLSFSFREATERNAAD